MEISARGLVSVPPSSTFSEHPHTQPKGQKRSIMSSPGICRAYAAGQRCRFGTNCKFAHVRNAPGSSAPSSPAPPTQQIGSPNRAGGGSMGASVQRGVGTPRGGTPARSNDGVPYQACRIFWHTGNCDRGFECQFKHTKNPNAFAAQASDSAAVVETPDFSSIQELAVAGTNTTLAPPLSKFNVSEVHNHIKPFLKDNYTFDSTSSKMQGFIRVIASVNDQNKEWVRFPLMAYILELTSR